MTIEINLSALTTETRTALENGVVSRTIQQVLESICEKHKKAAVKEMEEFVARVITKNDIGFAMESTTVKITLPDV